MAQIRTGTAVHDVVVIGSGAGGGTATKVLADLGVSVLLLEAGPMVGPGRFQGAPLALSGARIAAPGRRGRRTPADRPASPTARPSAARSSKASPTRWRPAATSPGSGRACSAAAPTTTAASRCAWRTTTSSRRPTDGLGFDWPICVRGSRAVLRQGRALHRRHRHDRRNSQRAGRHLQPAGGAPRARHAGPALLREARHPGGRRHARLSRRWRATAGRPATTAASAAAAAGRPRTTPPATCRFFRRWRPAACRSSPTRWRAS